MSIQFNKIKNIPQNPGVYIFKDISGRILYIGKATNLRSRVGSYFRGLGLTLNPSPSKGEGGRGSRPIEAVIEKVAKIETRETESVLEALILESNLIKKHQPKYNVDLKDDKSFSYVVITKEDFPRVLIVRETELNNAQIPHPDFALAQSTLSLRERGLGGEGKQALASSKKLQTTNYKLQTIFGPYTSKKQLEIALKIIRKIFPFHSRKERSEKGCLDYQIGLCPGPYAEAITKEEYKKNIRGIRMILEGKKKGLIRKLEKEMEGLSKKQEFEKAGETRNKIFALKHIRDVALISNEKPHPAFGHPLLNKERGIRIEAYDISNISGKQAVGGVVVLENGKPNKKEYRKFKIKTVEGANDVGMMAEVLWRRFQNNWKKPDLILLDGGKGHLNMARKVLKELKLEISLAAVAKGPTRKNVDLQILAKPDNFQIIKNILANKLFIKSIMDEAHRFAIAYHKKVRRREFFG